MFGEGRGVVVVAVVSVVVMMMRCLCGGEGGVGGEEIRDEKRERGW